MVWQDLIQISGDSIDIRTFQSTFEQLYIHDNGFITKENDSIHYDQISGKEMTAYLKENQLTKVHIIGNSTTLYYPSETSTDSLQNETKTIQGQNKLESSEIMVYFKDGDINRVQFIEKPTGVFKGLNLLEENDLYLKSFIWMIEEKPSTQIPK